MPIVTHSILYLASANPGKVREFSQAAHDSGISVIALPGIEKIPPCAEDGATFEENARQKARHFSTYASGWVFADDSGILVDALGGAPGVYSARYAGPQATDAANNEKLLDELHRVESGRLDSPGRSAHYVCVIALADRGEIITVVEGRVDGVIIDTPRGSGGFGYDPYFYYPPLGKTFAELSPEHKFAVSHRGKAFRSLLEFLRTTGRNS